MGWLYEETEIEEVPEKAYGFIYIITNLISGRKYLGRKYFTKAHSRQVKGKIKKSRIESDWKAYWGSNTELQEDVKQHGEDNFKREIIHIGFSRGEINYVEAKEIFVRGCLESNDWYNGWVSYKGHASSLGRLKPKE